MRKLPRASLFAATVWKQPPTRTVVPELYAATGIWAGIGGGKSGDAVPVQIGTLMTTGPEGWCSFKPL
jgi:hypothetical protein